MKRISALFSLLFLTGCMIGPSFQPPHPPCKKEWLTHDDVAITNQAIRNWWSIFNDPTLDHLIDIAYQQNYSLQTAVYRIQEARARLGIAIGEFFPQIQEGVGTVERIKLSRNQANPPPILDFKNLNLGFQAAWELDFWGRYRRGIRFEERELYATYYDYNNAIVLLFSDVASIYVRIRTLEEQMSIVRDNIAIERRGLEISEAQFEGGFVSELDTQQATALLRSTEARIPDLERQHNQAMNALCVLLGIAPQDISCLLDGKKAIPVSSDPIDVYMPEALLYRRPDILRRYYQAAAQSERIGIAMSDFLPKISLFGIIGVQAKGKLFDRDSLTYDYGSEFAWPLFNYGRIYNNVRLQESKLRQVVSEYMNQVLVAYQEVEDGLVSYSKYKKQSTFLEESARAALRAVELSKTQYVEGMTDFTTVINTQETLLDAQESWILSKGNIALSLINTYKALGGGWDLSCEECD